MDLCRATVLRHLAYHRWATEQTLESVAPLSHEELNRDMMTSHSSVWGTLVHSYQADSIWLQRHLGNIGAKLTDFAPPETLTELGQQWAQVHAQLSDYASSIAEANWMTILEYRFLSGVEVRTPIYENLLHVVNHGTYHRGQIVTILRQLGARPISTDFIRYVREIQATE